MQRMLPAGGAIVSWRASGKPVPVAQLDRALDSDSKGQRFESSRVRHKKPREIGIFGVFCFMNRAGAGALPICHGGTALHTVESKAVLPGKPLRWDLRRYFPTCDERRPRDRPLGTDGRLDTGGGLSKKREAGSCFTSAAREGALAPLR